MSMNNVVLFDGVCNLCNSSVDFIIRNEKADVLMFASLQSDFGREIVSKSQLNVVPDSVMFYTDGRLLVRSEAIFAICIFLKAPYSWAVFLKWIPRFIRDGAYKFVARNRYGWFGKKDTCRVPSNKERAKFLG